MDPHVHLFGKMTSFFKCKSFKCVGIVIYYAVTYLVQWYVFYDKKLLNSIPILGTISTDKFVNVCILIDK